MSDRSKHSEARRLLALGFKLCELHPMQKRPVGNAWQKSPVKAIRDEAGGYGLPLALNKVCSIDPDNLSPAREGLARCGFGLDKIMQAGVRTTSTRPGSGGRSTFQAPAGLGRVVFASKALGTILELRAGQSNLQDCLPGTVYRDKNGGGPYVQAYANGKTLDVAPALPADFLAWWKRCDEDLDFLREQQQLFGGDDAVQSVSKGTKLAFASPHRTGFNGDHSVEDLLTRHGYTQDDSTGRWAPVTATGTPCVREIPGKDGLWQSDHASDPLHGTFDAWTAYVVLEHDGDLGAAENAAEQLRYEQMSKLFDDISGGDDSASNESATDAESKTKDSAGSEAKGDAKPEKKKNPLLVQTAADFCRTTKPLEYFIPGVLPRATVGAVFGPSGSGKTFYLLHMLACLALGRKFYGKDVQRTRVVYGALEGVAGVARRIPAYERHYEVQLGNDFMVLTGPVALTTDQGAKDLIEAINAVGNVGLVAIDTLAQATPGADENAGKDMSAVMNRAKAVTNATGAMVLLVGHTGKDTSRGLRGWSGIKGALDVEIEVSTSPQGDLRVANVTKLKDGQEGGQFGFNINSVPLGIDEAGGVAVETLVSSASEGRGATAGAVQGVVLRVLEKAGQMTEEALVAAVVSELEKPSSRRDTRKQRAKRAVADLVETGRLIEDDGFYSVDKGAL